MGYLSRAARTAITSDRLDARVGQMLCFVGAAALFVLAVRKLCTLYLEEGVLIVGLLAAIACSLLLVVLGLLIPISIALRKGRQE